MIALKQNVIFSKEAFETIFNDDKLIKVFNDKFTFCFNLSQEQLNYELDERQDGIMYNIFQSYPGLPIPIANENILDELKKCILPTPFIEKSLIIMGSDDSIKLDFKKKFGIKWILESEIKSESFFGFKKEEVLYKGNELENKNDGWGKLLGSMKDESINSIFINDRNLFTNVYNYSSFKGDKELKNLGVQNMRIFFDEILPKNLKIPFHILICTEQTTDIRFESKIIEAINDLTIGIKSLRDYIIIVEFILYNSGTRHYAYTHNRRMLFNYHFAKVDHGFDLFKYMSRSTFIERDDSFEIYNFVLTPHIKEQYNQTFNRFTDLIEDAKKKVIESGQSKNSYRIFKENKESVKILNRLFN